MADKLKSMPEPVSTMVCGLSAALSVITRVPVRVPPVEGSKKTPMVQLTFGATLLVQPLV